MTVWAIAVLLGGNSHPGRRPPAVTFARGCAFGIGGGRPPLDTALSAIGRGPSVEFLTPYRRPTVATGVSHQPCPVNGPFRGTAGRQRKGAGLPSMQLLATTHRNLPRA